ncbi:MAG: hypothetical protein PHV36_03460 [Elusimicrobiales bacterium]|nr:hypothetical protein [Elusimicrobiales bacterium]
MTARIIAFIGAFSAPFPFTGIDAVSIASLPAFPAAYFGTVPYTGVPRLGGIYRRGRLRGLGRLGRLGRLAGLARLTGLPRLTGVAGLAGVTGLAAIVAAVIARAVIVAAGLTAVVTAGLARLPTGMRLLPGLTGLPTIGQRLTLRIFLFLEDLFKTVVNIRQLHNPVA